MREDHFGPPKRLFVSWSILLGNGRQLLGRNRARMISIPGGRTESTTIATITRWKYFFTT